VADGSVGRDVVVAKGTSVLGTQHCRERLTLSLM